MITRRTLGKIFDGQVRNTGGAIFPTGGANAPPVKQLKCLGKLKVITSFSKYPVG